MKPTKKQVREVMAELGRRGSRKKKADAARKQAEGMTVAQKRARAQKAANARWAKRKADAKG